MHIYTDIHIYIHTDKNKYSLQSDASLGSIVQGLENAFKLAKQNWRLLVICPVILALLGLLAGWFLNDNVKTHLFFEFRFAAFPGKTIRLSITGKSSATLIFAGGHS